MVVKLSSLLTVIGHFGTPPAQGVSLSDFSLEVSGSSGLQSLCSSMRLCQL